MDITRRSALRFAGIALGGGLAGCSSPAQSGEPTSSTTSGRTPSSNATTQNGELTFSATVTRQSSADTPAKVEATLTNGRASSVRVGFGPALLFTDGLGDAEWADDIVIDPETYVGPWADPIYEDGCWRYPEDGDQAIQSILEHRTLEPEESITESYQIYTNAGVDSCLPEGTYRFQDEGVIGETDDTRPLRLTLELQIDDSQAISATTESPTIGN